MEPLGRFVWKSAASGNLDKVEIHTSRLKLTPVEEGDAEAIFREMTPAITEFMIPSSPRSILDAVAFIRQTKDRRENDQELIVTLRSNEIGSFVGVIGLHALAVPKRAEIGLWLAAGSHGQGFGFEGCTAILGWARDHVDLDVVEYPVDRRNVPSRKLVEKLGGKVTEERRQLTQSGGVLDELVYEIGMHCR